MEIQIKKPNKKYYLDMYEYASKEGIGSLAGWPKHTSPQQSYYLLHELSRDRFSYIIYHIKDKKMIGTVSISKDSELKKYSLGYCLNDKYWGRNYAKTASTLLIDNFFKNTKINVLYVSHFIENKRSQRVIEKLGFVYVFKYFSEIYEKDILVYILNKNDWLERKLK